MPVAYKVPLPPNLREEFDSLDLRGKRQVEVACSLGCGTGYALIYDPAEVDNEMLNRYSKAIEMAMGVCDRHPPKLTSNF